MSEQFDMDYASQDLSDPSYTSQDPAIGDTESSAYQQCQGNLDALYPILSSAGWVVDCNSDPGDGSKWNLVAYPAQAQGQTNYQDCMSNLDVLENILENNSQTAGQWYVNACCSDPDSNPGDPNTMYNLVIYPAQ